MHTTGKNLAISCCYLILLLCSRPRMVRGFFWTWAITDPHDVGDETILRDDPTPRTNHRTAKGRAELDFQSNICSSTRECSIGHFCDVHYGVCRPYKEEGDGCRADSECQLGLDCMFGICVLAVKSGHKGARCASEADCGSGLCCARRHGERICKAKLRSGQRCFVPDGGLAYSLNELCPCDTGLICGSVVTGEDERRWEGVEWNYRNRLKCVPE